MADKLEMLPLRRRMRDARKEGFNQYKHEAITAALIFLRGGGCKSGAIKVMSAPCRSLLGHHCNYCDILLKSL